jgi:hypothetical protein
MNMSVACIQAPHGIRLFRPIAKMPPPHVLSRLHSIRCCSFPSWLGSRPPNSQGLSQGLRQLRSKAATASVRAATVIQGPRLAQQQGCRAAMRETSTVMPSIALERHLRCLHAVCKVFILMAPFDATLGYPGRDPVAPSGSSLATLRAM